MEKLDERNNKGQVTSHAGVESTHISISREKLDKGGNSGGEE